MIPFDPNERTTPPPQAGSSESEVLEGRTSDVRALSRKAHAAGDVLVGKYRLVSLLGEGGMGAVWRARSIALDIDVAVKVVRRDAATSDASERLLREARAAASIGHPAIVRIFDFGVTEDDEPYLVMELLEGESLGDWLDREQRIAAGVAVQMMLPVISALAAAHAQGIVHRDIKPENIVVARGEGDAKHPKLLDFGIVKFSQPRGGRVLTEVGMLMGSPEYMSPEQAQGIAEIDGQTDVWSCAVVLYELITGRRPFSGSHSGAVLISIFRDTPVPTTELAAGDDELWSIIERGMEKSPEARWDGMRELGAALGAWAIARGIETDAAGVSIARHWLGGSRASLSGYTPPQGLARISSGGTPPTTLTSDAIGHVELGVPSVRSVTRSEPIVAVAASWGRRKALIAAGAVAAVIAVVTAIGLNGSPSIQATIDAPTSPVAVATAAVAPPAAEPVVVAPAPVEVASAVTPTTIASSTGAVVSRVNGAPSRPVAPAKPGPRGGKTSMPLPSAPNF
ncbi:MAG: serine/threonine-protein kinase [Byssovorax sp.]